MGEVTTIGLDIAKSVFQAHAADAAGSVVFGKKLSRGRLLAFFADQPKCVVAMEACAGAHHWGRELMKLGHTGAADPAGLREALRQTAEERCGRRCASCR
jgi:transposase